MYKVIRKFVDTQDKNHIYNIGDIYPRNGSKSADDRAKALSKAEKSELNKTGRAYLKEEISVKPSPVLNDKQ